MTTATALVIIFLTPWALVGLYGVLANVYEWVADYVCSRGDSRIKLGRLVVSLQAYEKPTTMEDLLRDADISQLKPRKHIHHYRP